MGKRSRPYVSLIVLDAGLDTRVVDLGRPRSRRFGVPVGGAADRELLALANALVGNAPDAAGLEIAVKGPILRAEVDLAVAVVGAPFRMQVGRDRFKVGQTMNLAAGDELHIGGTPAGLRAYLGIAGGLETPIVLGSRSSLAPLPSGTALPCRSGRGPLRRIHSDCPMLQTPDMWTLHVLPGSQSDWFASDALVHDIYAMSSASNRMGLRLEGTRLAVPDRELISEPVCPGSIQVTRDGQPIVLGVDGQTIGGYPKIAQVADADLDLLGRMRPGERVRLVRIDRAEAERLWFVRAERTKEWRTRIEISLAGP